MQITETCIKKSQGTKRNSTTLKRRRSGVYSSRLFRG